MSFLFDSPILKLCCYLFLMLDDSSILVGGTGSFGKEFIRTVLRTPAHVASLFIHETNGNNLKCRNRRIFKIDQYAFFLGDVRDKDRLSLICARNADYVIHAAALKQVPAAEYNPHEFIKTNVNGATNIVEAAIGAGVKRVVALSTDKAVNPVNLYGATKLLLRQSFYRCKQLCWGRGTTFSVVRYGNVVGSRGSVIPLFQKQRETGEITITNPDMTAFLLLCNRSGLCFAKFGKYGRR